MTTDKTEEVRATPAERDDWRKKFEQEQWERKAADERIKHLQQRLRGCRNALERLLGAFEGDWPTIKVKKKEQGVFGYEWTEWRRFGVDYDTRNAVVHARDVLKRIDHG